MTTRAPAVLIIKIETYFLKRKWVPWLWYKPAHHWKIQKRFDVILVNLFAWSDYWNRIEGWLWLQPRWNWKGFSFLATFTTGWADALGVHPFNHSHCRFLPQSTTPGKTWWFHDTFNQHQTHNISVTKAAKPRTPPSPPRLTLAELEFYPNISPRQIFC